VQLAISCIWQNLAIFQRVGHRIQIEPVPMI